MSNICESSVTHPRHRPLELSMSTFKGPYILRKMQNLSLPSYLTN
jgi:hypothetical protein